MSITKNKIIILITAVTVTSISVYYATAGIFKPNTQVVNDLTTGLVGYWTFDGQDTDWSANTVNDVSGNSGNGTMINMSTTTDAVPGVIGQALDFDGSSNYISVPDTGDTYDFGANTPFTVSAWVKTDSTVSKTIVSKGDEDYVPGFTVRFSDTRIAVKLVTVSEYCFVYANVTNIADNNWHKIDAVINRNSTCTTSNTLIYLDGVQQSTTLGISGLAPNTDLSSSYPLEIGRYASYSQYFNGAMDEVRIYNRVLSQLEITELYNQGAKRLTIVNKNQKTDIVPDGLTGYWTFDGQDIDWASNTVNDLSGNGYDCTTNNISTTTSPIVGVLGQALNFNGINTFVSSSPIWNSGVLLGSNGTMSVWTKPTGPPYSSTTFNDLLSILGDLNGGMGIARGNYDGNGDKIWAHASYWDGSLYKCIAGLEYSQDEWVHVTWVLENDVMYIYKNGVQADSMVCPGSSVGGGVFQIGRMHGSELDYYEGDIDEVRTYNRALDASEILELYNQGAKNLLKVNMPQTDLVPDGLVGYWTFDGQDTNWSTNTVSDLSGSGNTGTITNMSASTSPVPGIVGQAFSFDGDDDYVEAISGSDIYGGLETITMMAWIKRNGDTASGYESILGDRGDSDGIYISSNCNGDNHLEFGIVESYTHSRVEISNSIITDGEWHHVAGVYNGDTDIIYIYVDGAEQNNTTGVTKNVATEQRFIVGRNSFGSALCDGGGTNTPFNGLIDEARVYQRALGANEIKELYMAGAGR